jgi:hypothetical protein
MATKLLSAFLAITLTTGSLNAQDKLDRSKKELNEGSTNSGSKSRSSTESSDSDDGIDSELWADIFTYTIGGVFYVLFGSGDEEHLENELTECPYYAPEKGNYFNSEFAEGNTGNNFRIDIQNRLVYNSNDLFGNHLDAKIRPFQYFYFKAEYYQLIERQELAGTTDGLSLFYLNFAYDRLRFERFNLGWTTGVSYVGSGVNKAGFSFGLQAEYFLQKNVSFAAAAKWSAVNGKPVNAYEAQARFHKKNYFLTFGVEQLKIASPNYTFVTLGAGAYF